MKKCILRKAFYIGTALAVPAVINRFIFKKARKQLQSPAETHAGIYHWRFGRVHYTVSGKGLPLLLVHHAGLGGSIAEWKHCMRKLARHYTVYALDLPGFGLSDKPEITYSAYLYVSLLNDFVKKIIRRKVFIMASGRSAAYALMAYMFSPALYKKIILAAPTGVLSTAADSHTASVRHKWKVCLSRVHNRCLQRLLTLPLLGTFLYNMMTTPLNFWLRLRSCSHDPSKVTWALAKQYYLMAHAGGAAARFTACAEISGLLDAPISHILRDINIPVRIVTGEKDSAFAASLRALLPKASKVKLPRTGSVPAIEHPHALYKVCRAFLG